MNRLGDNYYAKVYMKGGNQKKILFPLFNSIVRFKEVSGGYGSHDQQTIFYPPKKIYIMYIPVYTTTFILPADKKKITIPYMCVRTVIQCRYI